MRRQGAPLARTESLFSSGVATPSWFRRFSLTEDSRAVAAADGLQDSIPALFLRLLLLADGAFIAIHLLWLTVPGVDSEIYTLYKDRGHAEFYQYTKDLWIIVLLLSVGIKTRSGGYAAWALLFGYLLLDDALEIHETAGLYIATELGFVPLLGLRPEDFGEIAVHAIAAVVLLGPLAWFYLRGAEAFRRSTRHLMLLLVVLAFFGVFVDLLHIVFLFHGPLEILLSIVEDGGEMLTISFAAWYALLLTVHHGDLAFPLRHLVGRAVGIPPRRYRR